MPHIKEQFEEGLQNCCSADRYEPTVDNWFARTCCQINNQFDARAPGLMKEEWSGSKMICLCSKSYVAISEMQGRTKLSLKGVNKSRFADPTDVFERVLKSQKNEIAINRGIKLNK